jgi:hypothetical protein
LLVAHLAGWKSTFTILFNIVAVVSFCVLLLLSEHGDVYGSGLTVTSG